MTAASKPQLDYAPGAPIRRRKRIWRASVLIVLVALVYCGWRYGPEALRVGKLLYFQRQCLAYAPPGDRVVYDENPGDRLKQPGYTALSGRARPVAAYIAPPLTGMGANLPGIGAPGATLFLHELRNSAGQSRLVLVQRHPVFALAPTFRYPLGLEIFVFEPGTMKTAPKSLLDWRGGQCENSTDDLRFYAGQIDPKDAGHFTIRYALEGKSGVIEGRLNETGDGVKIKVRSGPAESLEE